MAKDFESILQLHLKQHLPQQERRLIITMSYCAQQSSVLFPRFSLLFFLICKKAVYTYFFSSTAQDKKRSNRHEFIKFFSFLFFQLMFSAFFHLRSAPLFERELDHCFNTEWTVINYYNKFKRKQLFLLTTLELYRRFS